MKTAFYPKLALDGIRKNRKLYQPYILTCVMMVAMYYIIAFLCFSEFVKSMPGGATVVAVMNFGSYVIYAFAVVFLFYTNSFLIRRRKKEFGLYNVLGMDKHGVGKILAFETLVVTLVSLVIGIFSGIVFSKLAELGLTNMIGGEVSFKFTVSLGAIRNTVILFAIIFFLIFLNSIRQVRFANPIELVRSENTGEKPPKGNWFFGIIGIIILAVAYYLAVNIENPVEALLWFFIAVILVIVATYLIFIAGSVLLCRILQRKKGYYYKKQHFVSVSGMVYRMKRNGAGLASITILLTMVFVMISSTACLYFGAEDSINTRYPGDISVRTDFIDNLEMARDDNISLIRNSVITISESHGAIMSNKWDYRDANINGLFEDGMVNVDIKKSSSYDIDKIIALHFIPLEDYNRMTGNSITLDKGEALAYSKKKDKIPESLSVGDVNLNITQTLTELTLEDKITSEIINNLYLVIADFENTLTPFRKLHDYYNNPMLKISWYYGFDTGLEKEEQVKLRDNLENGVVEGGGKWETSWFFSHEKERDNFYGTYGGFFFLGIMLSVVFLVAAVLIIYYKQISEGYEEQARFDIMQKVGMKKTDIRSSINSQMLTVFFTPILFAVLHLGFALPMIRKLLLLFNLSNLPLLLLTTGISIIVFALFYVIVYRITSNAYYAIVSGAKE